MMELIIVEAAAPTLVVADAAPAPSLVVSPAMVDAIVVLQTSPVLVLTVAPQPAMITVQMNPPAIELVVDVSPAPTLVIAPDGGVVTINRTGAAAETLPNRTLRGTGGNVQYIYVGFSSAAIGSENEAAAQWKIYRFDTTTDLSAFADGDELFDNIWTDRASLTYP